MGGFLKRGSGGGGGTDTTDEEQQEQEQQQEPVVQNKATGLLAPLKNNARKFLLTGDKTPEEYEQELEEGGTISDIETIASAGNEYLFDNPDASVQDASQDAIKTVTGSETDEEAARKTARFFGAANRTFEYGYDKANSAIDDTQENAEKQGAIGKYWSKKVETGQQTNRFLADVIAGAGNDTLKNFTGIDASKGDDADGTATAGAFALADAVPALGSGTKLATKGAKTAGKQIFRKAGTQATKQTTKMGFASLIDDFGTAAARQTDNLGSVFRSRFGSSTTDDVAQATDNIADDMQGVIDDFSSFGDDFTETTTQTSDNFADDSVSAFDDLSGTSDNFADDTGNLRQGDEARFGDDTVDASRRTSDDTVDASRRTSDDGAGSTFDNLNDELSFTTRNAGTVAATAGLGGTVFGLGAASYIGDSGLVSDPDTPDTPPAPPDDDPQEWNDPEVIDKLRPFWALAKQTAQNSNAVRFFVGTKSDGKMVYLDANGEPVTNPSSSETPTFDSEKAARRAHETWFNNYQDKQSNNGENSENGGGGGGGGGDGGDSRTSDWQQLKALEYGWFIYGRTKSGKNQFVIVGEKDGSQYYINKNGKVVENAAIFDSSDAVSKAWRAFMQRIAENGGVNDSQRMSGKAPNPNAINSDTGGSGVLGGLSPELIGGAALAAGLSWYYIQQNGGDL